MTDSGSIDADRAFAKAARARRRAAAVRRLRGEAAEIPRAVADIRRGIREIPLDAIRGTLEPARAGLFDRGFRPARSAIAGAACGSYATDTTGSQWPSLAAR